MNMITLPVSRPHFSRNTENVIHLTILESLLITTLLVTQDQENEGLE